MVAAGRQRALEKSLRSRREELERIDRQDGGLAASEADVAKERAALEGRGYWSEAVEAAFTSGPERRDQEWRAGESWGAR
mgnify:CR=1 FL=1